MLQPKEITKDDNIGEEFASFDYYSGMQYAKENNLKFSTLFREVAQGSHYLVCCGDVMVAVTPEQFPDIARRII